MNSIEKTFHDALSALRQNRFSDAERLFKRCIKSQPSHVASLNLLTIALMSMERPAEAETYISRAVAIDRGSDASFHNYGIILTRLNRPREALEQFSQAIRLNARAFESWNNRGIIFNELKQFESARSDFAQAIRLNAGYAEAHCNSGNALNGLRRYDDALRAYETALALNPRLAEASLGIGVTLTKLKRYDEALAAYGSTSQLRPGWTDLLLARGGTLIKAGRHDDAVAAFTEALTLAPHLTEARIGLGDVFLALKRHDQALATYDAALGLDPASPNAWLGRGNLLFDLRRSDDSLQAYNKALALLPELPEAWLGLGNILFGRKQFDEALQAYDKALTFKPDLAEAWLGRGNILLELRRADEAIAAYSESLALKADLAEAWLGRGNALARQKQFAEAFTAFDMAMACKPDLPFAEGLRLYAKLHLGDWSHFAEERKTLLASIGRGVLAISPFPLLGLSQQPRDQLLCARLFLDNEVPAREPIWQGQRSSHDRIRVAYLSADFCDHPLSYLLAGVIEHHDRDRFEHIAISFGPSAPSQMRERLKAAFCDFIDVNHKSDGEVARLLRELEVDIAVDLTGYTASGRIGILAHRPCPIQVSYLGYPGTMGADYIDYLIADQIVVPPADQPHYAEKLVYLPDCYQANDSKRAIGENAFTREDMGLPRDGFVFCCFNDTYKITPDVFDCWMDILGHVDNSVLWLLQGSAASVANLGRHAEARGISAQRIVFAQRVPLSQHLARHALADLFLDTLPYNAHTTASDALWTGLPVLTLIGTSFAGRVAASLLTAVGLPELITVTTDDYRQRAIQLATDPDELAAVRDRLDVNRRTMPLFDTGLFAQHLETAYTMMHQRHREGLPPDHIYVPQASGRE